MTFHSGFILESLQVVCNYLSVKFENINMYPKILILIKYLQYSFAL